MEDLTNLTHVTGGWLQVIEKYGSEYGLRLLGALVVLIIGMAMSGTLQNFAGVDDESQTYGKY